MAPPVAFSTATNNIGIRQTPRIVAISIPEKTVTPITLRDSAPAPDAVRSGTTPRMNANAVIRMGLNRSRADEIAASITPMPWSCCIFANSTMRIAFFAARPISMMRPICAKTLFT